MSDLSILSVTGRLTKNAEEKTSKNGKFYIQMDIAVNTGFGDNQRVSYVKVNKWGDSGKKLLIWLTKGTQVSASGEMYINKYKSEETGKEYTDVILTAQQFNFFTTPENSKDNSAEEITGDTIPF